MTNLLLCGCEPHGHKCLISEGGCGRCFEHCVCTPSGVASTGRGGRKTPEALARLHSGGSLNRSHACAAEGGGSFTDHPGRALSGEESRGNL